MLKNVYKVMRLVLMTSMITYVGACIIYFSSDLQTKLFNYEGDTFISEYFHEHTPARKLMTCCYFSITTLSTVGYGDITPKSEAEMIIVILYMLGGVAYFSYIMGAFIDII